MAIISGLDLGQQKDFSALACLDRKPLANPSAKRRWSYTCRWLQTWDLGTKYVAPPGQRSIAADVKALYETRQLSRSKLVADYGGVGRPVVDQLRAERVKAHLVPVSITGGKLAHRHEATRGNPVEYWTVPKVDLVGTLQVLLQAGLLVVDDRLRLAGRLRKELSDFRVAVTRAKNEVFGAEASQHDDLCSAVMLAAWAGERDGGGASGVGTPAAGSGSVLEAAPDGVFASDVEYHGGGRQWTC